MSTHTTDVALEAPFAEIKLKYVPDEGFPLVIPFSEIMHVRDEVQVFAKKDSEVVKVGSTTVEVLNKNIVFMLSRTELLKLAGGEVLIYYRVINDDNGNPSIPSAETLFKISH
ncbi:hypothetical protein [Pseudomonas fluorescens]|uniref:hypothetical protein n=1 Tax=Pseudomonas TaxID=286 RepID=UPI003D086F7D